MRGMLSPASRAHSLERLAADELDVLIVGGGVVGCGAALDAATRGLRVGLVEARDLGSGTSSRSTKLLHGGLRYLEQFEFGLVREALHERGLALRTTSPHLARPVPFVYPLRHRVWERAYVGAGVALYDLMSGLRPGVPRHRHLSRRSMLGVDPGLDPDAFVGAIRYHDVQVDDARHTMTLARTAAAHGALVATDAPVVDLCWDADRVRGAVLRDSGSGATLEVRARRVVNATGPWSEQLQRLAGHEPTRLRPSKGAHVVVPRERVALRTGLITRTAHSVLFVIPWGRFWLIGTTDTPWEQPTPDPLAHRGDVDYLLAQAGAVLRDPLTRDDLVGVFAGLRPLVSARETPGPTVSLSREHAVVESAPGLLTVAGGKYTTYRVMARDVIDAAVAGLEGAQPRSLTATLPLLGAAGYHARRNQRRLLAARSGLPPDRIDHLLGRYGDLVDDLLELVAEQPDLAQPLDGAAQYLRVELVYAASHEGARHLADALWRRTHAAIETRDRGVAAAAEAARLMAGPAGWEAARTAQEVDGYRLEVEALRAAEEAEDDAAAVQAHDAVLATDARAGEREAT